MSLLQRFGSLLHDGWQTIFAQQRSRLRALELALALCSTMGRRTISRTLCTLGRQDQDWSADYKLFSRSPWQADQLFTPVIQEYLTRYPQRAVVCALDDTKLKKSGRKIPGTSYQRDPMSPAFQTNFINALRFLQASLIFAHQSEGDFSPRAFPVRFWDVPVVKKPGKRASEEQRKAYSQAKKKQNLSVWAVKMIQNLREQLDRMGASQRQLLIAADGGFCNQNLFRAQLDRTDLVCRCRKDLRLCFAAAEGSRRLYDERKFSPEEVRKDPTIPWQKISIYYGGQWREIECKELKDVLWQNGARTRRLRLIVIAPQPYKTSANSKVNFRNPGYYLSTDTSGSLEVLVQAAFDRWQIEVNHREEKSCFGVGEAQLRSPLSVERQPAFAVATYSLLHLAALEEYGPGRGENYVALPRWRRKANRPSIYDLLAVLRREECSQAHDKASNTRATIDNAVLYAHA